METLLELVQLVLNGRLDDNVKKAANKIDAEINALRFLEAAARELNRAHQRSEEYARHGAANPLAFALSNLDRVRSGN